MQVLVILTRRDLESIKANVESYLRRSIKTNVADAVERELTARDEAEAAARAAEHVKKAPLFVKGGPWWTVSAAVLSIVVMLVITGSLAANGATSGDAFINNLAFASVSIAGLGSILRAMAHGGETPAEKRTDHGGKLLTVVALSSGFTGAAARLGVTDAGFWIAAGVGFALLVVGVVLQVIETKRKNSKKPGTSKSAGVVKSK